MNCDSGALIIEDGGERAHRSRLRSLLGNSDGVIRLASAYVTDCEFLRDAMGREIRLMTPLLPMDIASNATSIESLRAFMEEGAQVRILPMHPRFHAKIFIFGESAAIVSSANLTVNAMNCNLEVGAFIPPSEVHLLAWYDRLWKLSSPLTIAILREIEEKARPWRRKLFNLMKFAKEDLTMTARQHSTSGIGSDPATNDFKNSQAFFACNTDRREGTRNSTNAFLLEQRMHDFGYAATWIPF